MRTYFLLFTFKTTPFKFILANQNDADDDDDDGGGLFPSELEPSTASRCCWSSSVPLFITPGERTVNKPSTAFMYVPADLPLWGGAGGGPHHGLYQT